jgi:hypothetical protein
MAAPSAHNEPRNELRVAMQQEDRPSRGCGAGFVAYLRVRVK